MKITKKRKTCTTSKWGAIESIYHAISLTLMVPNDEVSNLNVHVTIQSNELHTYKFIYAVSIFDNENHIISTARLGFSTTP